MSRWLKSVNTLLETLDGQVEDVVVETDLHGGGVDDDYLAGVDDEEDFESDDYDSDDDESEYESEELQSEFEEEEIVWDTSSTDGQAKEQLFPPDVQPFEEAESAVPHEKSQKQPAIPKPVAEPPVPPASIPFPEPAARNLEDSDQDAGATDLDGIVLETQATARPPPPPPPPPRPPPVEPEVLTETRNKSPESHPAPTPPRQVNSTPAAAAPNTREVRKVPTPPPAEPKAQHGDGAQKSIQPEASTGTTRDVAQVSTAPMSGMSSVESPPPSGYASAPNTSNISQGNVSGMQQQQLKRSNRELKKVQAEARQLRKHVVQLNTQLETAEAEMAAQRQELQRAAERMEKDRARKNEEREDLLDEHDEELENMKEHYEKLLADQKDHYEEQVEDLQDRVAAEEEKRMQEGGDWTQELEESVERERQALKRLTELKEENASLQSRNTKLEAQQNALQKKLESSAQNYQTASQREREAEDKLDAALSLHSRQLSQRQVREAELERMIADLGAALTVARQKENRPSEGTTIHAEDVGYRKQYELAVDELETVKVQLSMETQRCEALRQELHEIATERTEETLAAQARQQKHDREIADLTANIARLEASLRETKKTPSAPGETTEEFSSCNEARERKSQEVDDLKEKIASLSEQLIRLQEKNDASKSELFALKNRLQASNARAESAEKALAAAPPATTAQMYEAEAGGTSYGSTMRRRVKGGRSGRNPASVRSIRSALNMHPGRVGEGAEPVIATIDAIDSFAVETGSFMRHEPLARLAFLMYLVILHLWAFCLVLFHAHTFEKEHGDFGSLSESGGLPGEGGHS